MEIRDLYLLIKSYFMLIFLMGVFFGSLGVALFYFWPKTYLATGSFVVQREVAGVFDGFESSGVGSQQSAISFTETTIGFLESVDMRKRALEVLNTPVTDKSLREAGRRINTKKVAPQLITLEVKGRSALEASSLWLALSNVTLNAVEGFVKTGDSALHVKPLSDIPVVKQSYRNVFLNLGAGFLLGIGFSFFALVFLNYLGEEEIL